MSWGDVWVSWGDIWMSSVGGHVGVPAGGTSGAVGGRGCHGCQDVWVSWGHLGVPGRGVPLRAGRAVDRRNACPSAAGTRWGSAAAVAGDADPAAALQLGQQAGDVAVGRSVRQEAGVLAGQAAPMSSAWSARTSSTRRSLPVAWRVHACWLNATNSSRPPSSWSSQVLRRAAWAERVADAVASPAAVNSPRGSGAGRPEGPRR